MRQITLCLIGGLVVATIAVAAPAAVLGPYSADAYTLHLYHFDESTSASLADTGSGTTVNLASNKGTAGVAAYNGFGTAFDIESGGVNPSSTNAGNYGRACTTGSAGPQSDWQGTTGAFTYELLLRTSSLTATQGLLCRDGGNGQRGWFLQMVSRNLSFYNGTTSVSAAIPTDGDNAFVSDEWFHVAVTYNGIENTPDNLTFYWTRVSDTATQANAIGTAQLAADATTYNNGTTLNLFGVGAYTRGPWRFQVLGHVDEVRISSVARGADEFIFAVVPEPASASLLVIGAVGMILRRRKHK